MLDDFGTNIWLVAHETSNNFLEFLLPSQDLAFPDLLLVSKL